MPPETEEHRCQNPACRKPLLHRRKGTKWCSPRCAAQVRAAEREAVEPDDDAFISQACRYPTQQQASLLRRDMRHRHPYAGRRIHRYSGYCVIKDCECKCHPWNQTEEAEAEAA